MYWKLYVLLFGLCVLAFTSNAQIDSVRKARKPSSSRYFRTPVFRDSASLIRWQLRRDSIQRYKDSVKAVGDSLSMVFIKKPDPNRRNRFRDSLIQKYLIKNLDFEGWAKRFPRKIDPYDKGDVRPKGELWIVAFVILLLFCFALLKNAFSKELSAIIHAFYSNRVLSQINKEEKFFNSWPFIFLYVLFGFIIGMFLYQCGKYFQLAYGYQGVGQFLRLSAIVIVMYTAKLVILRILGFLFDAAKLVKEYVSILILSYFNLALLFLPIVIAFCLTPARFAPVYIYLSFILIGVIFFVQFLRAASNVLTSYRFPIMYLIFYLCALEICPLLILIKALRF